VFDPKYPHGHGYHHSNEQERCEIGNDRSFTANGAISRPNHTEAYFYVASLYDEMMECEQAVENLLKWLSIQPDWPIEEKIEYLENSSNSYEVIAETISRLEKSDILQNKRHYLTKIIKLLRYFLLQFN
jgi:hypothetical protein